jgi:hypothetical protein
MHSTEHINPKPAAKKQNDLEKPSINEQLPQKINESQ